MQELNMIEVDEVGGGLKKVAVWLAVEVASWGLGKFLDWATSPSTATTGPQDYSRVDAMGNAY